MTIAIVGRGVEALATDRDRALDVVPAGELTAVDRAVPHRTTRHSAMFRMTGPVTSATSVCRGEATSCAP